MNAKILETAKKDFPLYFEDFKSFWDDSVKNIKDEDLIDIYKASLVFKNWKTSFQALRVRDFDLILDELYEDVNSSLYLAMYGLYRSSHMHLRSSIELTMQLLYFIHHPIEYHKWKEGDFVIKHDVLSEYLINHPNYKTNVRSLVENINKIWKLFSKHIHGESPLFFQSSKDAKKTNSFTEKDYGIWKSNYLKNIYYLNKLILLFFVQDLNRLPEASRNIFTSFLKEEDADLLKVS